MMLQDNFAIKLLIILIGYSSVLLPFYFIIQYISQRCKENDPTFSFSGAWWARFLRSFAVGHPEYLSLMHQNDVHTSEGSTDVILIDQKFRVGVSQNVIKNHKNNFLKDFCRLFIFFSGIQLTLVSMGFFQERIVTQGYILVSDPLVIEKFDDAQFLVFINRMFGLLVAGMYLVYDRRRQPIHIPPLYAHSVTSISNTISSWCQYEALKYVSFLTQTVCKASKVIPTMLMGWLLRKESYTTAQYGFAFLLVVGASVFFVSMTGQKDEADGALNHYERSFMKPPSTTTLSGITLMACYLMLDAFTPNFQKKLMETRVSRWQMMFYVNAFSAFLCLVSLLQQFTFFSSFVFVLTHYDILRDCCLLSLGSACGQIFIYATIEEFGPVVLSVLMTLRHVFSIILSSIYFSHSVTTAGMCGLSLVFGSILADTYCKYFQQKSPMPLVARRFI